MFNFKVKTATGDVKIKNIKRITQDTLDVSALILAADAASAQIARSIDPTLRTKREDYPKHIVAKFNAMRKGLLDLAQGLPFTVNVVRSAFGSGLSIDSFIVMSSTRPGIFYTPSKYACQCEGYEHHGNCKHQALYSVFEMYVGLLNAEQNLVEAYAKLGLELSSPPAQPLPVPSQTTDFATMLQDFLNDSNLSVEQFAAMVGATPEEVNAELYGTGGTGH